MRGVSYRSRKGDIHSKIHGISVFGIAVAAAAWLWRIFGVGVDTGFRAKAVYYLHRVALADPLCMLRYVLVGAGSMVCGFRGFKPDVEVPSAGARTPAIPLTDTNPSPSRPAGTKASPA